MTDGSGVTPESVPQRIADAAEAVEGRYYHHENGMSSYSPPSRRDIAAAVINALMDDEDVTLAAEVVAWGNGDTFTVTPADVLAAVLAREAKR